MVVNLLRGADIPPALATAAEVQLRRSGSR